MNLTSILNELRAERTQLKERLRKVEATLRSLEQLETEPITIRSVFSQQRGTLREQVLGVLQSAPGQYFKPRQIADLIQRNNITVGQVLSIMRRELKLSYSRELGYALGRETNATEAAELSTAVGNE